MREFGTNLGNWVIRYRWPIIVSALLFAGFCANGMRYLSFNNDTRVFFSKQNPQLQALETLENTYIKTQNVFFVIEPKNKEVFTQKTLALIEELTQELWKMPYSSKVDSITNFQHARALEDDLIVDDLIRDAETLSDNELKRLKQIAVSEPLLVNRLVSPSGHVTGINVMLLMPGKSLDETDTAALHSRQLIEKVHAEHPDIKIHLTGSVMADSAFAQASRNDLTTLVPIMFLVLVLLIGISLRSFFATLATLMVIALSMTTGMGIAGWLKTSLNPASVNAPTIILTLAVADSVHLLVSMFQHMRLGKTKREAIAESVRINLQPVFLTSITTAIGFLSMNFSDAPPFRHLGNIVACGVAAAFFYSLFLLPAIASIFPFKLRKSRSDAKYFSLDWFANFVIRKRNTIFWASLACILIMISGIHKIELNDNLLKYFDKSYEFRRATEFTQNNLCGWDIIEYSLESGETNGIHDPQYLATVDAFADWHKTQPNVMHVYSIANTVKRLNKNMHADDEAFNKIPKKRELAAQYLLLYELSLPFGLDLNDMINVDRSATRMVVRLKNLSALEIQGLDTKARQWLKNNAPEKMFTYGSGLSIIWAHIAKRNIDSMLSASFGALVLISLILIFALRNLKLGLLSLIPNLAPAFMAFGIWGLTMGRVGLALSVVASMTLGIVVDDTIHFISKYLRARREHNMNSYDAIRHSFKTVGLAMWITTLALTAGFLILATSDYKMNAHMGILSAITIALALGLDVLFLPTLLMKTEGSDE
ncbi:RND family transporter [Elusimicrobiota bacterium]